VWTLWNPSQSWMISWAEPWLMGRWCAASSIVTCQLSRIVAQTGSIFSSVVDVDQRPDSSSSVTLVWLFLNMVIHLYILQCGKALLPYCAESLQWISAPGTSSAHKHLITARCTSLAHRESRAVILTSQSLLLPVHKISSAANTSSFRVNYCSVFLTHLCVIDFVW
jgi:hypothetical protein